MTFPDQTSQQLCRLGHFVQLTLSAEGKLMEVEHNGHSLFGWSSENLAAFDLTEHFLKPNNINNIEEIFSLAGQAASRPFFWKQPDGQLAYLPTFWLSRNGQVSPPRLMAIINPLSHPESGISVKESKKFFFQATRLGGLLHNITNTLGIMMGRAEMLHRQMPKAEDLGEIIKASHRMRDILFNSSFKIDHENTRQNVPISIDRFIEVELAFLAHDKFFRHQVAVSKPDNFGVPQFDASYWDLSGILSESLRFFRQLMLPREQFQMDLRGYYQKPLGGIELSITGPLALPDNIAAPAEIRISPEQPHGPGLPGLDTFFLATCVRELEANVEIRISPESLDLKLHLPVCRTDLP